MHLAAAIVVLTFAGVLVVRRQLDNVLVQESLVLFGLTALGNIPASTAAGTGSGVGAALAQYAWASAGTLTGTELITGGTGTAEADAPAPTVSLPLSGIHLRVLADGEPGACDRPLWWSASGTAADEGAVGAVAPSSGTSSTWRLLRGSVSDGENGAVSRLLFVCPDCLLSAAAVLRFALHHSCQAMVLQLGAVTANGSITVATAPPAETAGSAQAGLLARVAWAVAPVLGTHAEDGQPKSRTRGYQLLPLSLDAVHKPTAAPATLQPAAAEVVVTVSLPLQPLYSATVLSQKTSLVELLSSVLALSGIFGIFARVFAISEGMMDGGSVCSCTSRRRGSGSGSGSSAAALATGSSTKGGRLMSSFSQMSRSHCDGASDGKDYVSPAALQLSPRASAARIASRAAFAALPVEVGSSSSSESSDVSETTTPAGAPIEAAAPPSSRWFQRLTLGTTTVSAGIVSGRHGGVAVRRSPHGGGPLTGSAAAVTSVVSHRSPLSAINSDRGGSAAGPIDGAASPMTVNPLHAVPSDTR